MKKTFKSFISFTRAERIGLACLSGILVILVLIRTTMSYWIKPNNSFENEQKLNTSWVKFKRVQSKVKDTIQSNKDGYVDATDNNPASMPDIIDLNTVDSATLVRINGIGPVSASRIVRRRSEIGPYTNIDQIREVASISESTFNIIKIHFTLDSMR